MTNYFYRDTNGQRRGPYDEQQLRTLEQQGIITPTTPLETDRRYLGLAGQIPVLNSNAQPSPQRASSGESLPMVFDIGFTHFLTPVLTTIAWWVSVFAVFVSVMVVTSQFPEQQGVAFLVCTIIGLLNLMFTRLVLEFLVIAFRIERHLRDKLREQVK